MAGIVRGDVGEYREFAAALKQVDSSVRRHTRARIREAAKPLGKKTAEEGANLMPRRGGYREHMRANTRVTISITQKGARLVLGRRGAYPAGPNRTGLIRHPVPNTDKFGFYRPGLFAQLSGQKWATTRVVPGTWTRAFERNVDAATQVVGKAVTDVMEELAR